VLLLQHHHAAEPQHAIQQAGQLHELARCVEHMPCNQPLHFSRPVKDVLYNRSFPCQGTSYISVQRCTLALLLCLNVPQTTHPPTHPPTPPTPPLQEGLGGMGAPQPLREVTHCS
jgi:hypothetical protein